MRTADNWRPSSVLKLSKGRAPCSAITKDDRILVIGPSAFDNGDPGELVSILQERDQVPRLPSGRSSHVGFTLHDNYLYMVSPQANAATASTDWVLYKSDLDAHLESTLTRVVNFFFSSFWKPVNTLPYTGMVLIPITRHNRRPSVLAIGGWHNVQSTRSSGWFGSTSTTTTATPLACVQELDLATQRWTPLPDLLTARRDHAVVEIGGCVVVLGGKDASDKSLALVEQLDCASTSGTWRNLPPLSIARHNFGVTVAGSCIVVAGGFRNSARLVSVEYLDWHDLDAGWRRLPDLPSARSDCGICFYESMLVVTGGYTGFGLLALDTTETLQVTPDTGFTPAASVVVAGEVLEVGTSEIASASVLEVFPPPATDLASAVPMPMGSLATPAFPDALPPPFLPQPSAPMAEYEPSAPMAEYEDNTNDTSMLYHTEESQAGKADGDNSCPVCMDKPKQIAFYCGHQACVDCAPLFQECHTCRLPIEGRIRLYG